MLPLYAIVSYSYPGLCEALLASERLWRRLQILWSYWVAGPETRASRHAAPQLDVVEPWRYKALLGSTF